MPSFKKYYRTIFETFGYPLTEREATPREELAAAEKRLGVKAPPALRDYYLVAGRERRFNVCCHRLMPPEEWRIDKHRLLFIEENQVVCWWGVSTRNPASEDPPVSQGINDDPVTWYPVQRKCSVFLLLMLHYQAVSSGYRYTGAADVAEVSKFSFQKHGWTYHGELHGALLCGRRNQVLCLTPPGDLPFMQNWWVSAGGKTARDLKAISAELGVTFD